MHVFVASQTDDSQLKIVTRKLANILKPVTVIFSILGLSNIGFGIQPAETRSGKLTRRRFSFTVVVIRSLFVMLIVANLLQLLNDFHHVLFVCGLRQCSLESAAMALMLVGIVTYAYLWFKEREISLVLSRLLHVTATHLISHARHRDLVFRKLNRFVLQQLLILLLFTLLGPCVTIVLSALFSTPPIYVEYHCQGPIFEVMVPGYLDQSTYSVLYYVFYTCGIAIFDILLVATGLLLIGVVFNLLILNFEMVTDSCRLPRAGNPVKVFLHSHHEICQLLVEVNGTLSFFIFIALSLLFSTTICFIRGVTLLEDSRQFAVISFTTLLIVMFSGTVYRIDNVNSMVITSLTKFPMNLCSFDDKREDSREVKAKLDFQLYCTRLTLNPPSINGWGYFSINKHLLLSAATVALTYILILYNVG